MTLPAAAALTVLFAQNPAPPSAPRVTDTERVCQSTGDVDWETGRPTAAQTLKNFGLDAADLGYPVEHDGKLVLLFGDSWPAGHGAGPAGELPPDDAVGVTLRRDPPTPQACLDLVVHSRVEAGKRRFDPAAIRGSLKLRQGYFNVPSGGVSVAGSLYAFFRTDHCSAPNPLGPLRIVRCSGRLRRPGVPRPIRGTASVEARLNQAAPSCTGCSRRGTPTRSL